jgi:hypothetical protein
MEKINPQCSAVPGVPLLMLERRPPMVFRGLRGGEWRAHGINILNLINF